MQQTQRYMDNVEAFCTDCAKGARSACSLEMPCDCCCHDDPDWYVEADAIYATRNNGTFNQTVVLQDSSGDTVLTTHSLDFGWDAWGPRLFVGKQTSCDGGWELGYLGLFGGSTSVRAADPANLDIPTPLSTAADDFNEADAMTLSWNWHLNNAEANLFRQYGPVQMLAGFRYLNLEEHFNINSEDSDGDVSDYTIRTRNNLYGGQIGARTYYPWKRFRFGVTGKAGVFGNDALEHQIVFDNNNTTVLRDAQGRAGSCSFVGDVNAFVTVQICRHWRLRGGYYWLWATHVALAPDQLDFNVNADSGTVVHNDGNLFVQGATFGVEAAW